MRLDYEGGKEEEDDSTKLNFNLLPRPPNLVSHVEPSEELGWVREDSKGEPFALQPGCGQSQVGPEPLKMSHWRKRM